MSRVLDLRPFTAHNSKHKVVYAVHEGVNVVMGGIVYALNADTSTGWIVFSFTEPEWRQKGVYAALHVELEKIMVGAGMDSLASHVHVDNTVRQTSCEKVGMVPEFYRMNKSLKG